MNNVYVGWKRFGAFIIDSIILIIAGVLICITLYNQLLSIGRWAVLIGFIIFMLYYGLQNSALCKGQTVGKRILKIKVVSENGQYLTPVQSMLRALVLTPILIFNNFVFPLGYAAIAWSVIVGILTSIQIILFFANRPSRQLLHDLIIKSVCVNADAQIQSVEKNILKPALAIGIPIMIGLAAFFPLCNLTAKMFGMSMNELGNLQQVVKQSANAKLIGIHANYSKNINTNTLISSISYAIDIPKIDVNDKKLCIDNMAKVVLALSKSNEKMKEFNVIHVSLIKTVDIGLFRLGKNYNQSGSWQQWAEYMKNNNIE